MGYREEINGNAIEIYDGLDGKLIEKVLRELITCCELAVVIEIIDIAIRKEKWIEIKRQKQRARRNQLKYVLVDDANADKVMELRKDNQYVETIQAYGIPCNSTVMQKL